jgi:hypothetical protein
MHGLRSTLAHIKPTLAACSCTGVDEATVYYDGLLQDVVATRHAGSIPWHRTYCNGVYKPGSQCEALAAESHHLIKLARALPTCGQFLTGRSAYAGVYTRHCQARQGLQHDLRRLPLSCCVRPCSGSRCRGPPL